MKQYVNWIIKGLAMGAADIVPGVSGGTLAFILGIYERLLAALASFNTNAVIILRQGRFTDFWRHIDGTFLCCLFGGIILSIFSLATAINFLLLNRPVPLWAFFNGLILAALPLLLRSFTFNLGRAALLLTGATLAITISLLAPTFSEPATAFYFVAGFIAICAMILPGISGSFLLLLMGMYTPIVAAVSERHLLLLALFGSGCVVGLLVFSRVLTYLLQRYHDAMLAFLCGIVIGALYRIWPWQLDGEVMSPTRFANQFGSMDIVPAMAALLLGAIVIQGLLRLERLLNDKPLDVAPDKRKQV